MFVRELTLDYEDGGGWSNGIASGGVRDVEVMFMISRVSWSTLKQKKRVSDNTVKVGSSYYKDQHAEAVVRLPSVTHAEKVALLEGAAMSPSDLTMDPQHKAFIRIPKCVQHQLPLVFRTHLVEQTVRWFRDFSVRNVINLALAHGPTECACVEAQIPCFSICFNKVHEELVFRTVEKYIMICMSTSDHRLFAQTKNDPIRASYGELFTAIAKDFSENQDFSDSEELPGVADDV